MCRRHRESTRGSTRSRTPEEKRKPCKLADVFLVDAASSLLSGKLHHTHLGRIKPTLKFFSGFILELLEVHHRRRCKMAPPWSQDMVFQKLHLDHPCDRLNRASIATETGLRALALHFNGRVGPSTALLRAAFGSDRLGSVEWRRAFMDNLVSSADSMDSLFDALPTRFTEVHNGPWNSMW